MDSRASLNESVRHTGARGRDRREDDEVEDMEDTERWMDKRESGVGAPSSIVTARWPAVVVIQRIDPGSL
jgi:hypothetical protein